MDAVPIVPTIYSRRIQGYSLTALGGEGYLHWHWGGGGGGGGGKREQWAPSIHTS